MTRKMTLVLGIGCLMAGILWLSLKVALHAFTKLPSTVSQQPIEVVIESLKKSEIPHIIHLPGRVRADQQTLVRPQVTGIVIKQFFQEGKKVLKGQQLYQIDDTRYLAILNSKVADLEIAQAEFNSFKAKNERYLSLVKNKVVSQQSYEDIKADYDKAKAAVNVAKAAVALAEVDVNYTKVYAPISGWIGRSYVLEGSLVTADQTTSMAEITQLDPVHVDIQKSGLDDELFQLMDVLKSGKKLPVLVTLTSQSNQPLYQLKGELEFSEVTMEQSSASITLRALVANPNGYLLPGMYVEASVNLGDRAVLMIPQKASSRTPYGQLQAWVVDPQGVVQHRLLKVQSAYQDQWIVLEGIDVGEHLIVAGYQKVKAGDKVNAVLL